MCNPRRVTIRTVEQLAEAWTAVLVRVAEATGEAAGEATLSQPYGENLHPAFRTVFERRLGEDPAWRLRDGRYVTELEGGQIAYDPESGDLELSMRVTERITVEGRSEHQVSGVEVHRVDVSIERRARTTSDAREASIAAGQAVVAEERDRLRGQAQRAQARASTAAANVAMADALARQDAQRRLDGQLDDATAALNGRARRLLEERRDEYLQVVNRVYAATLQEVVVALARQRGARNLASTETDGVIDISFELEA